MYIISVVLTISKYPAKSFTSVVKGIYTEKRAEFGTNAHGQIDLAMTLNSDYLMYQGYLWVSDM